MAKIHIDLPDDMKHEFLLICKKYNISMTRVVTNYIRGYCKRFRKNLEDNDDK